MNWEAIGAIGEIAGAAGVIVTLIYLAGQIRQNSKQIRGEAISTLAQLTQNFSADIRNKPELYEIAVRAALDWDSNSPIDQNRAHLINLEEMQLLETAFYLYEQGAIPAELYEAREEYMLKRLSDPGTSRWWNEFTYNLDRRFVARVNLKLSQSDFEGALSTIGWGYRDERTGA